MTDLERIDQFLSECGVFFLATSDGDQPKCRPLGFHMLKDGKIYFGIGTFKDVYKQVTKNPKVEICACKGLNFMRYCGKAKFDDNPELSKQALEAMPMLKKIYNDETGYVLAMFSLEDAFAEFRELITLKEKIIL